MVMHTVFQLQLLVYLCQSQLYVKSVEMNSTEVQNPRRKLDVFGSVLACAKSDHVSEALLLALRTSSLSFVTNNSSSDSKAFLRFIAFSGSQTPVHRAFLSSM